tara:strand:- start:319 stop:486 length:168 start_codon:yes stop_codon:yes gene_type:complete
MAIGGNYAVFHDLIPGSVPTLKFSNQEHFNICANFFGHLTKKHTPVGFDSEFGRS